MYTQNNDQPIRDISYIGKINKIKILNLIREQGSISRSEIAKQIGLSLPTVSRLVDSLVQKERLVVDLGTRSSDRGRPPNMVCFAGDQNFVIGLSIGRIHISGVLTNLNAEVIADDRIPTDAVKGFSSVVNCSANLIRNLITKSGIRDENMLGVGIAIGGLIDVRRSRIVYSSTFGWEDVALAEALGDIIQKPVKLDHDARVMALGEMEFGEIVGIRDFVCVQLGYGIGSSFIIDRKPFYGKCGMTGELGHITVVKDSTRECSCGKKGCLEAYASGRAIAEKAQEEFIKSSLLIDLCQNDINNVTAETVALAASQGDETCRKILLEAAEYIGIGLADMVNLFNPEAIILGGSLVQAGEFWIEQIRQVVTDRALGYIAKNVVIQPSRLGNRGRILGAVALILNEILNLNIPAYAAVEEEPVL